MQSAFARKPIPKPEAPQLKDDRVHEDEDDNSKATDPQNELKAALVSKFGSAKAAFNEFAKSGAIDKKSWRKIVRKTLPKLSQEDAKLLRKTLPKNLGELEFTEWMGEGKAKDESKGDSDSKSKASGLAELPNEVPVLPTAFKSRPRAQEQLILALQL